MHLLHDPRTVSFDGLGTDPKVLGNPFGRETGHDEIHNFALAWGQFINLRADLIEELMTMSIFDVTVKGLVNLVQERLIAERLLDEVNGAAFHRLDGIAHFAIRRDDDDRNRDGRRPPR